MEDRYEYNSSAVDNKAGDGRRRVWAAVLLQLYGAGCVAGFCVAISASLGKVGAKNQI